MNHPDIFIENPTFSGELDLQIKEAIKRKEKPTIKETDIFDKPKAIKAKPTKRRVDFQKRPKLYRKAKK